MDPRVTELQCIMPMANIRSVLKHGIFSHEAASRMEHESVALEDAQEKRDVRQVPGGLMLHQYANLYFHARNPMMSKRRSMAEELCILRVSTSVLGLDGVVLTDRNAAGGDRWIRFLPPRDWRWLDFDRIYRRIGATLTDSNTTIRSGRNVPRCWCHTGLHLNTCP